MSISEKNRRKILDFLVINEYPFYGRLGLLGFLERIWNLDLMPSSDNRAKNAKEDILLHMVIYNDWEFKYLLFDYLDLVSEREQIFFSFLENCLHPLILEETHSIKLLPFFNEILLADGYKLERSSKLLDKPVYKVVKIGTQKGCKPPINSLIFAGSYLNPGMNIKTANPNISEDYLVYDQPIERHGLWWQDLIDWWKVIKEGDTTSDLESSLHNRLYQSLTSEAERLLYNTYFGCFKKLFENAIPALLPQVYLYYIPYSLCQLAGERQISRQQVDFLLLLSDQDRIVIEVDSKQRYSQENQTSPKLYSEIVSEDRRMRLLGYEVYRFSDYELQEKTGEALVEEFFRQLFERHSIEN